MLRVLRSVQPKSLTIAAAAINAAIVIDIPQDMVITHGRDGGHQRGSKHYTDEALDLRSHHLAAPDKERWIEIMRQRLGSDYQVILEDQGKDNEHVHIEYDPA